MNIKIKETKENLPREDIFNIYQANKWSSANKLDKLLKALLNSYWLITAWHGNRLIGLGNALSDGYLVVYYPHLIVHPDYQGKGIGSLIVSKLQERFDGFHQQILVADGKAIDFYQKHGFTKAGHTESMWIYQGNDH